MKRTSIDLDPDVLKLKLTLKLWKRADPDEEVISSWLCTIKIWPLLDSFKKRDHKRSDSVTIKFSLIRLKWDIILKSVNLDNLRVLMLFLRKKYLLRQWICLRRPSYRLGFKSQELHLSTHLSFIV